jgi:apolipoprotein N-acyltransferase
MSHLDKKRERPKARGEISVLLDIILLAVMIYGYYIQGKEPLVGDVRVSVIQGNIPQSQKWDEKYADDILDRYIKLSKEAAKDKPDLIVWPETSVPGFLETDEPLREKVTSLAKELNTYLLVGTQTERVPEKVRYYNSAV